MAEAPASHLLYEGEPGEESFSDRGTTPEGYPSHLRGTWNGSRLGDLQDTRNLDNLILRQLHVVFLKFHNEAIRQLGSNPRRHQRGREHWLRNLV